MRLLLITAAAAVAACSQNDSTPNALPTAITARATKNAGVPVLLARAIYPANQYQPGPISGTFITGDNGVSVPFTGQPIPGFSAVLDAKDGTFWAMPDNGYGAKSNSGDFLLRLYHVRPDFKTAEGGSGVINVLGF